jgi:hypothetical protein
MIHALFCLKTSPGTLLEWHFWTHHIPSEGDSIILALQSPTALHDPTLIECRIRARVWNLDLTLSHCTEVMCDIVTRDNVPTGWTPLSERRFASGPMSGPAPREQNEGGRGVFPGLSIDLPRHSG